MRKTDDAQKNFRYDDASQMLYRVTFYEAPRLTEGRAPCRWRNDIIIQRAITGGVLTYDLHGVDVERSPGGSSPSGRSR